MPVSNPRTRLISFRVSEHEYARLRTLSNTQGSHSLADFVRASVCWVIDHAGQLGSGPAASPRTPSFGEILPQGLASSPVPAQTELTTENLAGLLRALQWKAESLDQELRWLTSLLKSATPAIAIAMQETPGPSSPPPGESVNAFRDEEIGLLSGN